MTAKKTPQPAKLRTDDQNEVLQLREKIRRISDKCSEAIEDGGNDYQYAIEEIAQICGLPVFKDAEEDPPEITQARIQERIDRATFGPARIEAEHRALGTAELTAITGGRYVEAIRLVRDRTQYGLAQCKQIVDAFRDLLRAQR